MNPFVRASRSPTPTPARWRVAVNLEFVVEATDQEAAISEAEELFSQVMPSQRAPQKAKVDVVMALPIRVVC